MTLNLTLLTPDAIYQSADFRLTDERGRPAHSESMKVVTLQYPEWEGFVTYTGLGQWQGRDVADYVVEWLSGLEDASVNAVIERIRERGAEFLRRIATRVGNPPPLTSVVGAFVDGAPFVATISNFADCSNRQETPPSLDLRVDSRRPTDEPFFLVTGQKRAVGRGAHRRIVRLARRDGVSPQRIRNELTVINAEAAASPLSGGTVSTGCSVTSFRRAGGGFQDLTEGSAVRPRSVMNGRSDADVLALLGLDSGLVHSVTFSRSPLGTPQPVKACVPRIVTPAEPHSYKVVELTHPDLSSAVALAVNENGTVLGSGTRAPRPLCVWDRDRPGKLIGFAGETRARGLNESGRIGVTGDMTDHSVHATRWFAGEKPEDLGTLLGSQHEEFADSGATAINDSNVVVGWVSVSTDPNDRGSQNNRPAAWIPDQPPIFLTEMPPFSWGQAVDVNEVGTVLVLAHHGGRAKALLWNPVAGIYSPVGGDEPDNIYPIGLTSDGMILGSGSDSLGRRLAFVSVDGDAWTSLGTPDGWAATAINDAGDVTGSMWVDGFERPSIHRIQGQLIWLPYLADHDCRPRAIANNGLVVGEAATDHGAHAILWTP